MKWQEKRKKEIDKLLEQIKQKFSVTKEELIARSRTKPLVIARRYFMNILFEAFDSSDKITHGDISQAIGRDRTSFIHHRKEHQNHHSRYKAYKQEYDSFKKEFEDSIK